MNLIIDDVSKYIGDKIGFSYEYIRLIILTLIIYIVFRIMKFCIKKLYSNINMTDKKKYYRNRNLQLLLSIICTIIVIAMWGQKLEGFITIVSFISAGVTIAIREIIFNFFAGMYIKIRKPFELEDRIEIQDEIKGDVIRIEGLVFEILEVGDRIDDEQSTGRIIHIPNSFIFTKTFKNYTKAFKYIWDEIKIKVKLDSNIEKQEEILYEILFDNEILRDTPKKMEDAVDEIILEYRIYYNNLEPIIYKKIVDSHIELNLRYLVHPRKARIVQDEIYGRIIEEYKKGNIELCENEH